MDLKLIVKCRKIRIYTYIINIIDIYIKGQKVLAHSRCRILKFIMKLQ